MEKLLAMYAIIWIIATLYFTFQAIKGDYPVYYGILTSTFTTGLGALFAYLLIVVMK